MTAPVAQSPVIGLEPDARPSPAANGGHVSASNRWIPELAGYRALAALAVFVFHIISTDPPEGILGRWTVPLGNAAVTLFFCLSGYLIYRPYARWAFDPEEPVRPWIFVFRRAVRILPLYWAVLTLHLFVTGTGIDSPSTGQLVAAYTLTQNFFGDTVFVPPFVAWSLSIELWFSFALPFLARILRHLGLGRGRRGMLAAQLSGLIGLAGFAVLFRVFAIASGADTGRLLWWPAYLDWFAWGMALAVWLVYRERSIVDGRPVLGLAPSAPLVAANALVLYWAVTRLGLPGGFLTPTAFQTHAQFILQGVMAFLLVALAVLPGVDLGVAGRLLRSSVLVWLGAVSYGIYLFHPLVIDGFLKESPESSLLTVTAFGLVGTIVGAAFLRSLVEEPAARAGERLARRWMAAGPTGRRSDAGSEVLTARAGVVGDRGWRAGSPRLVPAVLTVAAFVAPVLNRPGVYVADARFEIFADPGARLSRMLTAWDPTRDLGRPAEEFWPGVTAVAYVLDWLGSPPWLIERLWHGLLLALAAVGAATLSRALSPRGPETGSAFAGRSLLVGALYGFGPFSAVYLVPSTLYVSYALAPWFVVAVLNAWRGRHTFRWAAVLALALFMAGNADPPGLVLAAVPAAFCWLGLVVFQRDSRWRLLGFAAVAGVLTAVTSAAMLAKTSVGAGALSARLTETEPVSVVSAFSSASESIRGLGFWLLYFPTSDPMFRSHQLPFSQNRWLVAATVVPVLVGVLGLIRRWSKARLLALAWLVAGTIVMIGPFPVDEPSGYGELLLSLYLNSDVAFGFRSTHKAGVIWALGASVLGGWALTDMVGLARRRSAIIGDDGSVGLLRQIVRSSTWPLAAAAVVTLLVALSFPFWRGDLYDPEFTAVDGVPDYWVELEQWFDENPPAGRVLVLPGSTNNGYVWGSIGDDLLDPVVPNRVVSSTLPLSTPLGAEMVSALDQQMASANYQAGSSIDLVNRLGIEFVVVRNDLNWSRQAVAAPADLAPLRADPDFELLVGYGPVLAVGSEEVKAVEVYRVVSSPYRVTEGSSPLASVLPAQGQPRQILVDGDGLAVNRLAGAGLLSGGHPVRFAATVRPDDVSTLAGDVALVVLSDTNPRRDRRITYYRFAHADPEVDGSGWNPWLPDFSPDSATTVVVDGASVGSSIDRWNLGFGRGPTAAIDGDVETAWTVSSALNPVGASWWIELDQPQPIGVVDIALLDDINRIVNVEVTVDGRAVDLERNRDEGQAIVNRSGQRIEITFRAVSPGSSPVGLRQVTVSTGESGNTGDGDASEIAGDLAPSAVTRLPSGFVDAVTGDTELAQALADTPVRLSIGRQEPSTRPLRRLVHLWRDDEFDLIAPVVTDSESALCRDDVLSVDGEAVPVRIVADPVDGADPQRGGESGRRLALCRGSVNLTAGSHLIEFDPSPVGELALVSFDSTPGGVTLDPVTRRAVPAESVPVAVGDIVISPASFDAGWSSGSGSATPADQPVVLDGLTAWIADDDGAVAPSFTPQDTVNRSLVVTSIGLVVCCLLLLASTLRRSLSSVPSVTLGVLHLLTGRKAWFGDQVEADAQAEEVEAETEVKAKADRQPPAIPVRLEVRPRLWAVWWAWPLAGATVWLALFLLGFEAAVAAGVGWLLVMVGRAGLLPVAAASALLIDVLVHLRQPLVGDDGARIALGVLLVVVSTVPCLVMPGGGPTTGDDEADTD